MEKSKSMQVAAILAVLWCNTMAWAGATDYIWIEGETAQSSSVAHHGWYESVKKDQLSGGNFIANYGPKPGEATWQYWKDGFVHIVVFVR